VELLLSKGVVDSHSLHKIFHSFPKVLPSERTSIATRVAIVDNIELTIDALPSSLIDSDVNLR
jgi:hypothetical protein